MYHQAVSSGIFFFMHILFIIPKFCHLARNLFVWLSMFWSPCRCPRSALAHWSGFCIQELTGAAPQAYLGGAAGRRHYVCWAHFAYLALPWTLLTLTHSVLTAILWERGSNVALLQMQKLKCWIQTSLASEPSQFPRHVVFANMSKDIW